MMLGGGFMLIFGLIAMLLVIGLPLFLIAAVVASQWGLAGRRSTPISSLPAHRELPPQAAPFSSHCSHCGQGLQADWTHCPKCGAPV